ncbi:MAG: hypothetical protein ACI857_000822 [Arenicella sp.]|jgi:hypothetical protein
MNKLFTFLFFAFVMNGVSFSQCTTEEALYLMTANYTQAEIDEMASNPMEYEKTLYYYSESWYYIPSTSPDPNLSMDMILITRLEDQRLQSSEVEIVVSGTNDIIVLKSQDAIDAKLAEIESNY